MTTLTSDTGTDAAAKRETSSVTSWWPRLRPVLLAVAFPVALLAIWHFATSGRPASLIPPPYDVWLELQDLAFGGINDRFPWHGWIMAYNASTLAQTGIFNTSPNQYGAAVWQSGTGPASDGTYIYVVTGNGSWGTTTSEEKGTTGIWAQMRCHTTLSTSISWWKIS